jgi:hypothetical protein
MPNPRGALRQAPCQTGRPMVGDIINIGAVILGALSVVALLVVVARPDRAREREDAARAFFDAHGRWPDDPAGG